MRNDVATIDIMFVNSSVVSDALSLDEFRLKMIDMCQALIRRYGERNVYFHITDVNSGYMEVMCSVIKEMRVQNYVVVTEWSPFIRPATVLRSRDLKIITKISTLRQESALKFVMVLAVETKQNISAIEHVAGLASTYGIPVMKITHESNITSFIDSYTRPAGDRKRAVQHTPRQDAKQKPPKQVAKRHRHIAHEDDNVPAQLPSDLNKQVIPTASSSTILPDNLDVITDRDILENPDEYGYLKQHRMLPTVMPPVYDYDDEGRFKGLFIPITFPLD